MANISYTQVKLSGAPIAQFEWMTGGASGRNQIVRRCKITSLAQGGTTNQILPLAFGLSTFSRCSALYDATNGKVYPAIVDPVNNRILLQSGASFAVGDVSTTTAYIDVEGCPAAPGMSQFSG